MRVSLQQQVRFFEFAILKTFQPIGDTMTNTQGALRPLTTPRHDDKSMDDGLGYPNGWECHSPTKVRVPPDRFQAPYA